MLLLLAFAESPGLPASALLVCVPMVLAMLVLGWWVGSAKDSADGFLLAKRSTPAWAACLSFVAAEVSALTIIGVPGEAYRANWNYAQVFIGSALARVAVAWLFIPAFYRLGCTSAYEVLEARFGSGAQRTGAGIFFVLRLLASGVRLALAAGALALVLNVPLGWTLAAFTVIPVLFIGWGGMRAVVWTGVYQALAFIGGGIAVLAFLHFRLDGGIGAALATAFPVGEVAAARAAASTIPAAQAVFGAAAESGSRMPYFINLMWNTGPYGSGSLMGAVHAIFSNGGALWAGVFLGFFTSMASFGTDQENVQRLLCVETRRSSQRMMLWTILASGATMLLYLAIGSGLAAWYAGAPASALPEKTDQIFPHFIRHDLWGPLAGLMLGGVILASIDSPLASLTSSAIADFYRPLRKGPADEAREVWLSRVLILVFGLVLGGLGYYFSSKDAAIWIGLKIGGIAFGSLLGAFLVALLTGIRARRAPTVAMLLNAGLMGWLLYGIEQKHLWLAWQWLVLIGTLNTMGLIAVLRHVLDREPSEAAAPLAEASPVAQP
jgi:Na+/proline symporter